MHLFINSLTTAGVDQCDEWKALKMPHYFASVVAFDCPTSPELERAGLSKKLILLSYFYALVKYTLLLSVIPQ